jgi:FtsH-binding integral membrane protein
MAGPTADPLAVSDRTVRRAAAWLIRHGLTGAEPTPLLAARLRVRRQSLTAVVAALVVLGVLVVATFGNVGTDSAESFRRTATVRLIGNVAVVVAVVLARWLWLRVVRRADRRLGAALARRVAHPAQPGGRAVLGRTGLAGIAVSYGGALGIGIAALVLVHTAQDRLTAAVSLLGIAVLAVTTAVEVADILRRPALAEDPLTLTVDDVLRAEDARAVATAPVPAMLAAFTAVTLIPAVPAGLLTACYVLIGCSVVVAAWSQTVPAPVRTP